MSPKYSIPILIAFIALLITDEDSSIFQRLQERIFQLRDRTGIRSRLLELGKGSDRDFENFRIYQIAISGLLLFPSTALLLIGFIGIPTWVVLTFLVIGATVIFTERALNKRVERKRRAIEGEFPAIIEMLTLAVGAGESPSSAIRRIATRADGYLALDFGHVIGDIERGKPFHVALDGLSRKLASTSIRRFVDSLIISISRGTPLVETLAHSAQEARSAERAHLLSAAGKSEISMMIPVVFLILPVSILFALFPSLASLQLIAS